MPIELLTAVFLSEMAGKRLGTATSSAVVLLIIVLGINLTTKALTKHFDVTRKE